MSPPSDRPLVGTVVATRWLTPGMIRVEFGGSGLDGFTPTGQTDQYVNALFIPDGAPYSPPFDLKAARAGSPEQRPRGRRLTIRHWDDARRRLVIDIVTHGEVGFAGRWAQAARPGDQLQMTGPSGGYRPNPDADWHLFAGDESALPAIEASLECVPDGRPCTAIIVVDGPDHELALESSGDLTQIWLHRQSSDSPSALLCDAVASLDWVDGNVDVFVHGEAGEVRSIRRLLVGERGIDRREASISPYWRRGRDDEAWRQVKKQWLQDQESDLLATVENA